MCCWPTVYCPLIFGCLWNSLFCLHLWFSFIRNRILDCKVFSFLNNTFLLYFLWLVLFLISLTYSSLCFSTCYMYFSKCLPFIFFSLLIAFSNIIFMCCGMIFFVFLLFDIHWAYGIFGVLALLNFEIIIIKFFGDSSFWNSSYAYIRSQDIVPYLTNFMFIVLNAFFFVFPFV